MPNELNTDQAIRLTGYSRKTIYRALARREIPGARQRTRKSPWSFTAEGLQAWMRGETTDRGAA